MVRQRLDLFDIKVRQVYEKTSREKILNIFLFRKTYMRYNLN